MNTSSFIVMGSLFTALGLRLLLWMLLLTVERDHEGSAALLQSPSFYPSRQSGLMSDNIFGSVGTPRTGRSAASGSFHGVPGYMGGANSPLASNRASRRIGGEASSRRDHDLHQFSRPPPAGFGNPFDSGRTAGDRSAFKNLFGTDIGRSAGIFDSFGKTRSNRGPDRMTANLIKDTDIGNANPGTFKNHPFSSIRLTPVTHVSGVAVQNPTGQSPFNEHDDFRDRSIMFTRNRARDYEHRDPFERPISKSAFPLPSVNEPVTLDLAEDEQARVKYAKSNKELPPIRKLAGGSEGGSAAERPSLTEKSSAIPSSAQPANAFGWEKPPSIPVLPTLTPKGKIKLNNTGDQPNSQINGKILKLPELPSRRAGQARLVGSVKQRKPQISFPTKNTVEDQAVPTDPSTNKQPPGSEISAVSEHAGETVTEVPTVTSNEKSLETEQDSSDLPLKSITDDHQRNNDGNSKHSGQSHGKSERHKNRDDSGRTPASNVGETTHHDTKEATQPQGRYDVTVLTDEAITKKSGDLDALTYNGPGLSDDLPPESSDELPATKRVVERTIENGKQVVVANETHLPTDHVGFILTDDYYDDQADRNKKTGDSVSSPSPNTVVRNDNIIGEHKNAVGAVRDSPYETGDSDTLSRSSYYRPSNSYVAGNGLTSSPGLNPNQRLTGIHDKRLNSIKDGEYSEIENTGSDEENLALTDTELENHAANKKKSSNSTELAVSPQSYNSDQRPAIGSGYLMHSFEPLGTDIEDDTLHYPTSSSDLKDEFVYPLDTIQTTDTEDESKDELRAEPRIGTQKAGWRPDSDVEINSFEDDTQKTESIPDSNVERNQLDEDTENQLNSHNDMYDDMLNSPGMVVEQEHIGLENLHEYSDANEDEEETEETKPSPLSRTDTNDGDEDGANKFGDYNFEKFGEPAYPFSPAFDSGDDFSINTDPAALNFDISKAGEGNIHIRRSDRISEDGEKTAKLQKDDNLSADQEARLRNDNDALHNNDDDDTTFENKVNEVVEDEGIPTPRDRGYPNNREKWLADSNSNIEATDENGDHKATQAAPHKSDLYSDKFIDYSNYNDPHYSNYDSSASTGTSRDSVDETPSSSSFMTSPFQSMFGKSVDQAEQGNFGSLFQNLGQQPAGAGGGANGIGRDLFDERLGQIIEQRPSFNLFGRKRRR